MLSNIKTIATIATLVACLLGGVGGASLWHKYISEPLLVRQITHQQQQLCLHRTTEAANEAKRQEQARQQSVADDVRRAFELQMAARRAAHDAAERSFEQGISDYETKLRQSGRSCALDVDTLNWLRGASGSSNSGPG